MIRIFDTLDLNKDGFVRQGRLSDQSPLGTQLENTTFRVPGVQRLQFDFARRIDKNKDGLMSREEWRAYRKMLKAQNPNFRSLFVNQSPGILA